MRFYCSSAIRLSSGQNRSGKDIKKMAMKDLTKKFAESIYEEVHLIHLSPIFVLFLHSRKGWGERNFL